MLGWGDGAVLALEVGEQRFDEIGVFIEEVDAGVGIEACLRALEAMRRLPTSVRGPVDCCALARLAAIWAGDAMMS